MALRRAWSSRTATILLSGGEDIFHAPSPGGSPSTSLLSSLDANTGSNSSQSKERNVDEGMKRTLYVKSSRDIESGTLDSSMNEEKE